MKHFEQKSDRTPLYTALAGYLAMTVAGSYLALPAGYWLPTLACCLLLVGLLVLSIERLDRQRERAIRALEDRRWELESCCRQLEAKEQDLETFAFLAAHDLKAPLRAVDNLTGWVAEDCSELLESLQRERLLEVRERIGGLARLLGDLLEYARAGRQESPPEYLSLELLIKKSANSVGFPSDSMLSIETPPPPVVASASVLERVFRSVLSNAVRYRASHPLVVKVTTDCQGDSLVIKLSDNGRGIDDVILDKVFGLFHKTSGASHPVRRVRLGLATAKKCIRQMGGEIALSTVKGEGTTVTLTVPLDCRL